MKISANYICICIAAVIFFILLHGCEKKDYNIREAEETEIISVFPVSSVSHDFSDTLNIFNYADKKSKRKLVCKNITQKEFFDSIENPKIYATENNIIAGVVPHHTVAASLISGFFKAAADYSYDTVVIVSPNHQGDVGDVVLSFADWDTADGVYCDTDIVGAVYNATPGRYSIVESDARVEDDHSASVLIPYIEYYLPNTKVAAFLVSRTMTLEDIFNFAKTLTTAIKDSGKKVLFVCSADFSHYLNPHFAAENDKITQEAIKDRNYGKIYNFSNEYIDSPASLITLLMYLSEIGIAEQQILYNTDASEFLGRGISETTTYFVIAAYAE